MKNIYNVIKAPVITEKATFLKEENKIVLKVDKSATKKDVKDAVEKLFKVKVQDVRTIVLPGKWKRIGKNVGKTSSWKKAIVTLKKGEKLDFIES